MKSLFIVVLLMFVSYTYGENATKNYALITDLSESTETVSSIKILFDGIKIYSVDHANHSEILNAKDGLVILLSNPLKVISLKKIVTKYTDLGGTIFMDIRGFSVLNEIPTKIIQLKEVFVTQESKVTNGYKIGEPIRYNAQGELLVLNEIKRKDIIVLAKSEKNDVVLIEQKKAKGVIFAIDVISLQEPQYEKDSENKYFFVVNAIGNGGKYGQNYPYKYHYAEFVDLLKKLEKEYPLLNVVDEGNVSRGYNMFSLNIGNPSGEGILIFSVTHGNEWENAYGVINFIKFIASHHDQKVIDLDKYFLKVIPIINPFGYQNMTRQNGNLVDLNRNGDYFWETYIGAEGQHYEPGSYDWKGVAPFSEPETRIMRKITSARDYLAMLDIHGNPSGTGYNKWIGVANTTKTDAFQKGELFRDYFNESIKGRYVLRQDREKTIKPFEIESVQDSEHKPNIINSLSKDNYGYIVETLCGYPSTEFIVTQNDITCELCIAFCKIFSY